MSPNNNRRPLPGSQDLDAYLAALIEIGADANPGEDGLPDDDAWGAMQAVLDEMPQEQQQSQPAPAQPGAQSQSAPVQPEQPLPPRPPQRGELPQLLQAKGFFGHDTPAPRRRRKRPLTNRVSSTDLATLDAELARAPAGGVTIDGRHYPGGRFAPDRPPDQPPSHEAYGSEPPAPGWTYAGESRWLRTAAARSPGDPAVAYPRIAVIGGGPAGLFTTWLLNQKLPQAPITIFEASHRLGGKIKTDRFSDGTRFESGVAELYEYLGPGGKDPLRLLIEDELGLRTQNMSGGAVILGETILRDIDEVAELCGDKTAQRIRAFHEKMCELMPLENYATRWQLDNSHPWANCTFKECLLKEIPEDPIARRYVETAVHSDLATEPHTCNGLNGIKNVLMDNASYMQLYHVIGGIERIPRELSRRILADVRMNTRVLSIGPGAFSTYSVNYRVNDVDASADFDAVIVCLPNHWLSQIQWGLPSLEEAIHNTCAHYDLPAHYLRVSLLFRTPFWDRLDIPGDYWMIDALGGCAVYNEDARWKSRKGHVLSFLVAGQTALLLCSHNQDDACITKYVLDHLPKFLRESARKEFIEAQIDRYVGSINAQPGGWPAEELIAQHTPDPENCPALYICGDFLFDSTLNAALISANTAVDLLLEHFGARDVLDKPTLAQLSPEGPGL